MISKEVTEENNAQSLILDSGLAVDAWYYRYLDKKGKRPNYQLITALSIKSAMIENTETTDKLVEGKFEFVKGKVGSLLLSKELMSDIRDDLNNPDFGQCFLLMSCITFCKDNSKDELGIFAGHLMSMLYQECLLIIDDKYKAQTMLEEDFNEIFFTHRLETLVGIDIKVMCYLFN